MPYYRYFKRKKNSALLDLESLRYSLVESEWEKPQEAAKELQYWLTRVYPEVSMIRVPVIPVMFFYPMHAIGSDADNIPTRNRLEVEIGEMVLGLASAYGYKGDLTMKSLKEII